jgi:hypothetical protein
MQTRALPAMHDARTWWLCTHTHTRDSVHEYTQHTLPVHTHSHTPPPSLNTQILDTGCSIVDLTVNHRIDTHTHTHPTHTHASPTHHHTHTPRCSTLYSIMAPPPVRCRIEHSQLWRTASRRRVSPRADRWDWGGWEFQVERLGEAHGVAQNLFWLAAVCVWYGVDGPRWVWGSAFNGSVMGPGGVDWDSHGQAGPNIQSTGD